MFYVIKIILNIFYFKYTCVGTKKQGMFHFEVIVRINLMYLWKYYIFKLLFFFFLSIEWTENL